MAGHDSQGDTRENIDWDKLVLDALFFECEPDRSHMNAIRRPENNWIVCWSMNGPMVWRSQGGQLASADTAPSGLRLSDHKITHPRKVAGRC